MIQSFGSLPQNTQVAVIQETLRGIGFKVRTDGYYGRHTSRAVRKYLKSSAFGKGIKYRGVGDLKAVFHTYLQELTNEQRHTAV
jgi:hypothetical protein